MSNNGSDVDLQAAGKSRVFQRPYSYSSTAVGNLILGTVMRRGN